MITQLKVHTYFYGLFIIALLAQSCSQEIDLYAPHQTVPVVYALLDPDYQTQFIRVGQSFFYQGEDSILATPKLNHLEEDFDLYITYSDNLGSTKVVWFQPYTGVVRNSGLFAQEELQVFSAELDVENSRVYKLYLHLKESGKIVYAELTSFDRDFQVIDPLDAAFRTINLYPGEDFYFRFAPVSKRAVYQAFLTFNYEEIQEGIPEIHSLEFPMDIIFGEESDLFYVGKRFSGENFLKDLGQRIEPKAGIRRRSIGLDFYMSAGGEELYYLIKSANSQFGFSARSNTNLDNGVGIFSSLSHKRINNIQLSRHTIDSIAGSSYTKHLGFEPYSKQTP